MRQRLSIGLPQHPNQHRSTRGLAEDTDLRDKYRLAVEGEWTEEAIELQKLINTPYLQRSWAGEVASKALHEAEAQLAASPGVRTVGKVVADFQDQQAVWEKDKVYEEGR
jgi:hypothetical protein